VTGDRTAFALSTLTPTVPTPSRPTACATHDITTAVFLHVVAIAGAGLNHPSLFPFDVVLVSSLFAALPLMRPRPAVGAEIVLASAASDFHIHSVVADLTGKRAWPSHCGRGQKR